MAMAASAASGSPLVGAFSRKYLILKEHKDEFAKFIAGVGPGDFRVEAPVFYLAVAGIISEYVVEGESFGAREWHDYLGAEVGKAHRLPFTKAFYAQYHGPNPIDQKYLPVDKRRQVCESHVHVF